MKYYMKSKIFKLKEDFWITNEYKEKVFFVDTKLLTLGLRFDLIKDDNIIYSVKENLLAFLGKYEIIESGKFIKDKLKVDSKYGELLIKGDILDYNYKIYKDGKEIATIIKEFFSITDNYYIDIDFEDEAFILALVVIVDDVIDKQRNRN